MDLKAAFKQRVMLDSGLKYGIRRDPRRKESLLDSLRNLRLGFSNNRSTFPPTHGDHCNIASRFMPDTLFEKIYFGGSVYLGFFSADGMRYLTSNKGEDHNIMIYDTSGHMMKLVKTVKAKEVGWAVIDASISPDNRLFAYSSWCDSLYICSTDETRPTHEIHEALPAANESPPRPFCIFSLRFSSAGNELLCGANDQCIHIYDIERCMSTTRFRSHLRDVNCVAFLDESSQQFVSVSDDGHCKVWDRRCLATQTLYHSNGHSKPQMRFAAHKMGVAFVDVRRNGRHLATNGKDHCIRLWDLRSVHLNDDSSYPLHPDVPSVYASQDRKSRYFPEPDHCLMTFTGHQLFNTLIRCRFSPEFSTGQRYIYTGCNFGRVMIYDTLTGENVRLLGEHDYVVRDVSWHPYYPQLISSSWDKTSVVWQHESFVKGKVLSPPSTSGTRRSARQSSRDRRSKQART